MRALFLGVVLAMALIAGCVIFAEEQNLTNETEPPPPPPPAPTPLLSIVSPSSGEVMLTQESTLDVTLALTTQNLLLKSPGGAAKKGEGHFRVTLDDGVPQTVTTKNYLLPGLAIGEHKIKVELLNNDRTPYSPSIAREVYFTIEKEKPPEYVPQEYKVTIDSQGFKPASITVKVGDRVTWENEGQMPQTATCFIGGSKVFDTGSIASGKSATVTMTSEFECDYYSQLFRALAGKIKVESNGSESD